MHAASFGRSALSLQEAGGEETPLVKALSDIKMHAREHSKSQDLLSSWAYNEVRELAQSSNPRNLPSNPKLRLTT